MARAQPTSYLRSAPEVRYVEPSRSTVKRGVSAFMAGSNSHRPPSATKTESALASAATAFEDELQHFAAFAADLARAPLTSDKALVRAQKALEESSESQVRLAARLQDVIVAIDGARGKQEACMKQMLEAAERVRSRAQSFTALVERFAGLGQLARDINEPVRAVVARKAEGADPRELATGLEEVLLRTESLIAEAESLAQDAKEANWPDVARQADSLKQQMQSARNRLLIAQRSVNEPS
jgi:hypothetical protein